MFKKVLTNQQLSNLENVLIPAETSDVSASPSGGSLDVTVPSESKCGREKTKMVSSTIMFHCNPSAGIGIPEFMLETDQCQYLFVWHTNAVCTLT